MNEIFRPYLRCFVLFFFDDILVYSWQFKDHEKHLRIALKLVRDHQLVVNWKNMLLGSIRLIIWDTLSQQRAWKQTPEKYKQWENGLHLETYETYGGFWDWWGIIEGSCMGMEKLRNPLCDFKKKCILIERRSLCSVWEIEGSYDFCSCTCSFRFFKGICYQDRCFGDGIGHRFNVRRQTYGLY